eukprot:2691029-Alexandrium_andersonii.AAC.1
MTPRQTARRARVRAAAAATAAVAPGGGLLRCSCCTVVTAARGQGAMWTRALSVPGTLAGARAARAAELVQPTLGRELVARAAAG